MNSSKSVQPRKEQYRCGCAGIEKSQRYMGNNGSEIKITMQRCTAPVCMNRS